MLDDAVEETDPRVGADRLLWGLGLAGALLVGSLGAWSLWQGPVQHVDRAMPALPMRLLDGATTGVEPGRPTVLHVWLPGCGACAAEAPALGEVARRYQGQGVDFVSVSVVSDPAATRRAAAAYGMAGAIASTNGNLLEALDLAVVPSTVWISAEGRVVSVGEGALSERVIERETRRIVR